MLKRVSLATTDTAALSLYSILFDFVSSFLISTYILFYVYTYSHVFACVSISIPRNVISIITFISVLSPAAQPIMCLTLLAVLGLNSSVFHPETP